MPGRTIFISLIVTVLVSLFTFAASAQQYKYTGVRDCSRCHKKELIGDQEAVWKKTAHAKAFKTLKGEKALEIAKEKGMTQPPSESEDCLKCHATAFGLTADQFEKKPLSMSDGVQCESCHGPGSEYKGNEVMSDHDQSVAAGMREPNKDEKICTVCHNDESPSFKAFDYEKAKEEIAHPIPEHVKGKYLELEEAEGGKSKKKGRE